MGDTKAELRVTDFTDDNCPICYTGARQAFYGLHVGLWQRHFTRDADLGDETWLRRLAQDGRVPTAPIIGIWRDPAHVARRHQHRQWAARRHRRVTPGLVLGGRCSGGVQCDAVLPTKAPIAQTVDA